MKKMFLLVVLTACSFSFAQTDRFEPDGFFFPDKELKIGGLFIDALDIRTLDYSKDPMNPAPIEPEVHVLLKQRPDSHKAQSVTVTRDTLYFEVYLGKNQLLVFTGNFLNKRGRYHELDDYTSPMISGTMTYFKNGKQRNSQTRNYTYWVGD